MIIVSRDTEKRFIGVLIKGLHGVTRGASIFGRLISSVKKIGGSIFKGIHGLFHHHKVQAIYRAVNTFKKYHSKLKIGELFKFKAYCDLHISKVSLYDKLNKALHKFGNHMNHKTFLHYMHNTDNRTWYYDEYDDFETNWRKGFELFFLSHGKRLSNLKDFSHKVDHTDEHFIIQIPIFFFNNKQSPMDLYKLHTVHVPLDKDTYDGKESKYTKLDLKQNNLAISKEEYIDLTQHQLNPCLKLHTDYLCPNLRLTASTQVLSCAAAVFQSQPNDNLICDPCDFTYYEHITPPPAVLETKDEILLANLPPKWQLVCDNQIDRPIHLHSAIYAIINIIIIIYVPVAFQHNTSFSMNLYLYQSRYISNFILYRKWSFNCL